MKNSLKHYDLVVIGGGPAGTPVAIEYAKLNPDKRIGLIDTHGELGGECLFDGCIPSKIMEITAKQIRQIRSLKEFGISLESTHYTLAWEKIVTRKKEILTRRSGAAKTMLLSLTNVDLLKAKANFLNKNTLIATYEDLHQEEISFNRAVIATGSKAFVPHYEGNGVDKLWTNEDFFETMQYPETMSIIGDGPIAIEFAQILATLGTKINLIGRKASILKRIDAGFASKMLTILENDPNINLILQANVTKIDYDDGFSVHYQQEGQEKVLFSERLLVATGRIPNIDTLDLEKAGVTYTKGGIKTNATLQTTNPKIFANGDVVEGFPRFAHTAQFGAHTLAQNLFLEHNLFKVDYDKNSWVLFSEPNIAMAGISEEEAIKRGIDVIVDHYDYSIDAKSQIEGFDEGQLNYVVDKKSHVILGISIMTNEANAIAGEAALIVANKLTLNNLVSTIHPHPTLSESFSVLAKQMMGKIMIKKLENPVIKGLLKIERFL